MSCAILYSFRRCPYAMRARLAVAISGIQMELREVVLRDKPPSLLEVSPKATVPVLITAKGNVIDESIDIMIWALQQSDPNGWLSHLTAEQKELSQQLIRNNDGDFKTYLDRYKYADRYPQHPQHYYRQQAEKTLVDLEHRLKSHGCLISNQLSIADYAILPFIRQLAFVDKAWFDSSPYPLLRKWLQDFLNSSLFEMIMIKYPKWQEHDVYYFPQNAI